MRRSPGTTGRPGRCGRRRGSGFPARAHPTYFASGAAYAQERGLDVAPETLRAAAAAWSVTRGARSGRVAWQFIEDLTGSSAMPQPVAAPSDGHTTDP